MRRLIALVLVMALVPLFGVPIASAQPGAPVVISELHYHPQAVELDYPNYDDREDAEFIELVNLSGSAVDVSGWCVRDGIDFCFPSGSTLTPNAPFVIARDAAVFNAVYGFSPDAVYSSRLSNSGELVRLVDGAGLAVSSVIYDSTNPWPVTPDGNGPSLELINATGNTSSPAHWAASTIVGGTPGSVPSLTGATPPLVVSQSGPIPAIAGQPVTIAATAINSTGVSLTFDVDFGVDTTVAMTATGGGNYTVTLPALGVGEVMRYRLTATGPGGATTSPRPDDSITWWATAVPTNPVSAVPVLDIHINDADWADIENRTCGCTAIIVHEGRVWTDVEMRRAGLTSLTRAKGSYRLDFPDGHPFEASWLDGKSDELTLDQSYPNYDMIREQLAWKMMDAVGFPPVTTHHTRVTRNGDFRGLYLLREEQDGDWRSTHNLDNGAFYKFFSWFGRAGWRGEWEKKEALDEPDTDLAALLSCTQQSGAALRACFLDTVDVAQLAHQHAAIWMIRQIDQREFNWFLYRDDTDDGRWRLLPEDLDRVMSGRLDVSPHTRCFGLDHTPPNEICSAFMEVPEFKDMFNRRLRTLVDEVLVDPQWITEIQATEALIATDWAQDEAKWNRTGTSLAGYANELETWFGTYAAHLRSGGDNGNVPAAQSANPMIEIVQVREDAGDGIAWALLRNPSSTESVDISGWQFDGLATIADGAVVLPGATIAVTNNDGAFRTEQPAFGGIRANLTGTIAGQVDLVRRNGSVVTTTGTAAPNPLILNEYNAVSASQILLNGDPTFGTVPGNGGDWFELVVTQDRLDVRGWRLVLSDADGGSHQIRDEFVFTNHATLADLEAGLIITVSEDRPDDLTYTPTTGDWHINLQANNADDGAYFTAASQQNFDTNHHNWQLAIYDAAGNLVFGPAGEGIGDLTGVGNTEIGELETNPASTIERNIDYGDGNGSTYGLANVSNLITQDFTALRYPYQLGDVNCSGTTDIADALVISQLTVGLRTINNRCPLATPASTLVATVGDLNQTGTTDIADALIIAQCTVGIDHNNWCP